MESSKSNHVLMAEGPPLAPAVMPVSYSRAGTPDIPALISSRIAFLTDLLGPQEQVLVVALQQQLEQYFRQHLTAGTYICYVARCGHDIVGLGGMAVRHYPGNFKNPTGRNGYILNMYTKPAYRRQGICTTLLYHLIHEGRKQGLTAFELHATRAGEPVYRQAGFVLHEEPTYRKSYAVPSLTDEA